MHWHMHSRFYIISTLFNFVFNYSCMTYPFLHFISLLLSNSVVYSLLYIDVLMLVLTFLICCIFRFLYIRSVWVSSCFLLYFSDEQTQQLLSQFVYNYNCNYKTVIIAVTITTAKTITILLPIAIAITVRVQLQLQPHLHLQLSQLQLNYNNSWVKLQLNLRSQLKLQFSYNYSDTKNNYICNYN